jgi:N-acetylglucosamine-6-phosphate deacetylase
MALRAFLADQVIEGSGSRDQAAVLVEDGYVMAVVAAADVPAATARIKLPGLTLAPGLVDLQVNGGGGVLFNQNVTAKGIETIIKAHRECGTTALLPTLISDGTDKMAAAAKAVAEAREKEPGVIGIHFEGPFLNEERRGVHEAAALRTNIDVFDGLDFSKLGKVMITLAPELFEKDDLKKLSSRGATLSAGHSLADQMSLSQAKMAGLRGVTHLFNAMAPISAREPGLAGLALNDNDLWCSIIGDGVHVATHMVHLALKLKPRGKLFFVSDAMPPSGHGHNKDFTLYGKKIFVRDGRCVTESGGLAGSALTLFECVQKAVVDMGIEVAEAVNMASLYPAEFLGVDKEHGSFKPGARADFIAFDDRMDLQKVYIGGEEL